MTRPARHLARNLAFAMLAAALLATAFRPAAAAAKELAKDLFGAEALPAAGKPESYGFYSKGCFSGGVAIPVDGPTWEVMRPSRNRRWGHPALIGLLERFSREAAAHDGWRGLLIGDIAMPRGGPMPSGHASHQIGLDADIWFTPMPAEPYSIAGRAKVGARSLLRPGTKNVLDERRWSPVYARILKRAASYREVERIFVNPAIKKKLCETAGGDRAWLSKIRPFWGHDEHFHIRIACQPGSPDCKPQAATGKDDGCDAKSLAWWFTAEPWRPAKNPDAPKARDLMTMASLPRQCQAVLEAPGPPSVEAATYGGGGAPIPVAATAEPGGQPSSVAAEAYMPASAFAPTPDIGIPVPRPRPGD